MITHSLRGMKDAEPALPSSTLQLRESSKILPSVDLKYYTYVSLYDF